MPKIRFSSRSRGRGKGSKAGGRLGLFLFGGVFAAVGTAMFVFFTALPIYGVLDARGWVATPCTITKSEVETHAGDDGDTYSIEIRFTYQVNGRAYQGDRFRFAPPGSSSGYKGKKKIVNAHPVGSAQTCYVDPDDPRAAVIQRGFNHGMWWGLFPLPFMAVGYGIFIATIFGLGSGRSKGSLTNTSRRRVDWLPSSADQTGQVTLAPGASRLGAFIVISIFTLLWNAFITAFIMLGPLADAWHHGMKGFDICFGLFMVPFVIVGLVLVIVACRKLLLLFAPKVVLDVSRRAVPVGGSVTLRWHTEGSVSSVNRVTISLIGEESATYTRGTDTVTDTETFYEQVLAGDQSQESDFDTLATGNDRGELVYTVPADTMHSFHASRNKVQWKLRVVADVSNWPDPTDDHEITVLPMEAGG